MDKPTYSDAEDRCVYENEDDTLVEKDELRLVLVPEDWDYPYMG